MPDGKVLPHDSAMERSALISVLRENASLAIMSPLVSPDDFYEPRNGLLWRVMTDMATHGTPIDQPTLAGLLRASGEMERAGGIAYIAELTDAFAVVANCDHYARTIRSLAVARRVVSAALEIASRGMAGVPDVRAFVDDSRSAIAGAIGDYGLDRGGPAQMLEALREAYLDVVDQRVPSGLVQTGISTVDHLTGGLWPGVLTVLAGRPGMGKSAFLLNIATNAALAGKRVLYVTLEDTRYFVAVRLLSRFAKINNLSLTMRTVTSDQYHLLNQGYCEAAQLTNLWVDDASGLTTQELRSRVLLHADRHGVDLLVIDHLLELRQDAESETQAVSKAAASCRDLAKEIKAPVLLAHQLNRKVEDRPDKRPQMADLKQSGKVEEVARTVWFLYRPGYYEQDQNRRDIQCIVAKSNHGRTGMCPMYGDLSQMYIRGWETTDGEFPTSAEKPVRQSKPATNAWTDPDWRDR